MVRKLIRGGEHEAQAAVFRWMRGQQHPACRAAYAIPNAALDTKAKRLYFWEEGARAGVSDFHVPWSAHGYIGLWVEVKFGQNTPSAEQTRWAKDIVACGGLVVLSYSAEHCIGIIAEYLGIA